MNWKVMAVLLICVPFHPAAAEIIYVDDDATGLSDGTSWVDAHATLQDALQHADAAPKPVEMLVAQGRYQADQGEDQTAGDVHATFMLLDDVTIRGGYAGLGQPDPNARNLHAFATVLHGDLLDDDGPEFAQYSNNSQTIVTSQFNDDTAVLEGFVITAGHGWSGPGISCYDSNAVFVDCIITENQSIGREGGYGGGMYISGGSPTLVNCEFLDNWALADGGGLWCQSESQPRLSGCRFRGNFAATGGGISVAESFPIMTNCLFENNEAVYGGAVGIHYRGHPAISNCTFYGNQAQEGGALRVGYRASATVSNSILWHNAREISTEEEATVDITRCNIEGQWPGVGNIEADPLFAAPGRWGQASDPNLAAEPNDPNAIWLKGDYHLKSRAGRWTSTDRSEPMYEHWVFDDVTSPCIDAGDPNAAVDLEPLTNGGVINMGVYGNTAEASKSPVRLDSGISKYRFVSGHGVLNQKGGFAGVDWTYELEGQFVLDVDLEAGSAAFVQVDANAVADESPDRVLDLDTTLNLTGLTGNVAPDGTMDFSGRTSDSSTVHVQITVETGWMRLGCQTTPPPGSADFFEFTLEALAWPVN